MAIAELTGGSFAWVLSPPFFLSFLDLWHAVMPIPRVPVIYRYLFSYLTLFPQSPTRGLRHSHAWRSHLGPFLLYLPLFLILRHMVCAVPTCADLIYLSHTFPASVFFSHHSYQLVVHVDLHILLILCMLLHCFLHYHFPLHYFLPFAFSRCGMLAYHNADRQYQFYIKPGSMSSASLAVRVFQKHV